MSNTFWRNSKIQNTKFGIQLKILRKQKLGYRTKGGEQVISRNIIRKDGGGWISRKGHLKSCYRSTLYVQECRQTWTQKGEKWKTQKNLRGTSRSNNEAMKSMPDGILKMLDTVEQITCRECEDIGIKTIQMKQTGGKKLKRNLIRDLLTQETL